MRQFTLVFLSLFSFTVLITGVSSIFAKAPSTGKIIFGTYRGGNRELYLINPDDISTAREPDWSPDETKLAFMWHQKRPNDEGTGLWKIVNQPGLGAFRSV